MTGTAGAAAAVAKAATGAAATDEADTDEAGTDEAGTDGAGTDEAGTDEAGTDATAADVLRAVSGAAPGSTAGVDAERADTVGDPTGATNLPAAAAAGALRRLDPLAVSGRVTATPGPRRPAATGRPEPAESALIRASVLTAALSEGAA